MSKRKYTIITPIKLVHIFLCPSKEIWKILIDFHNYTEYNLLNEHMKIYPSHTCKACAHFRSFFYYNILKLIEEVNNAANSETYHFSNFYLCNQNWSSWEKSYEKAILLHSLQLLLSNTSYSLIFVSSCCKISIEFSPCDTFYRLEALLAQNGQTHKRNWWAHT